jgi:hypothetical protein
MAARYRILVTDELITAGPQQWPPMLHPVAEMRAGADHPPGTRWVVIEDDDAPEDMDGKEVALTFIQLPGGMIAVERLVIRASDPGHSRT